MEQNFDMKIAKFPFLNSLSIDDDVKDRLSQHLYFTVIGKDDVLVSPIAKEKSPSTLLSEFNKVFNSNIDKMNSVLIDLEYSNKESFGPRSIAIPWKDRVDVFTETFKPQDTNLTNMRDVVEPGRKRLRPLSYVQALKLLKNDTNSGLPFYRRKGLVKERVLEDFDNLLKRKDPCILFTRTQEQKKTRSVWGYPIADTLNEMRFYSPLLEHQRKVSYRSALCDPMTTCLAMTSLLKRCSEGKDLILLSIDFSAYDTTVKFQLQKEAFNYIKSLYQSSYSSEIDYIFERFNSIGIVTPYGVLKGKHGVPSGSTFTNEVDSIVQFSIARSFGIDVENIQVQGDDGVYLLDKDKVDSFVNHFKSFGLVVNEKKSFRSQEFAVYLQSLFHIDYLKDGFIGGIYPVYRALNRIIYQERWSTFEDYGISGRDYYSIRTICIVENCKYHPLFKELVKFVLDNDKYSLDYSDQGLSKYVQMIDESKGAGEILRHQFGDNVSGINKFETVKIIRELG